MDNPYHIDFDESKDIEIFYDFHGIQVMRHNTSDPKRFLDEGIKFDNEVGKRLDEKKRAKILYIADQTPYLTALIDYLGHTIPGISIGIYGIIMPKDPSLIFKFVETISFSLPMSYNKGQYIVKLFDHS